MTLYQNLKFKKLLFNYKKVDIVQNELVDKFHFRKNLNKKISEMSSGMAKISSLICGLLLQPKLIILDEPTNSIDFHSKNMLESFLLKFKDGKNTIINVSHDLDYVYNVSDRFVIIDNGEIVYDVPKRNFQNIEDFKKEYLEWTKTNE